MALLVLSFLLVLYLNKLPKCLKLVYILYKSLMALNKHVK